MARLRRATGLKTSEFKNSLTTSLEYPNFRKVVIAPSKTLAAIIAAVIATFIDGLIVGLIVTFIVAISSFDLYF